MNHDEGKAQRVEPIEKLAWYLDEAFRVPGTNFRVGWDAIIGLVPGLGETVMVVMQSAIVLLAVDKYQVPGVVVARMIVNIMIDSLFGAVPFVGDIFDMFYKANTKNVRLLNQVRAQAARGPVSKVRHYAFLFSVAAILLAVVAGSVFLVFTVLRAIIGLF